MAVTNIGIVILVFKMMSVFSMSEDKYLEDRASFLHQEAMQLLGQNLILSAEEMKINRYLMNIKSTEFDDGLKNSTFPPSMHFFSAKRYIDKSSVMAIIRKLPKGAALHVHDSSMLDVTWLIKNVTYRPQCFLCYDNNSDQIQFRFSVKRPTMKAGNCTWKSVKDVRGKYQDPQEFDSWLFTKLSLVTPDPEHAYPSQTAVWNKFLSLFSSSAGLVFYAPVFKDYVWQSLMQFYMDNVQYIEMRGLLPEAYELDGTIHDKAWLVQTYVDVTKEFKAIYPDFFGMNIIFTSSRNTQPSDISEDIKVAMSLKQKFPQQFLGYDLVGREDLGYPLIHFLPQLLYPSQNNISLQYFFHAGETDREGTSVDDNLIDAVLLNTTRIGHGFAILKHPKVKQIVKDKGIGIEVNPISNQVLKLVADLRNHPAAALFMEDFPVCVSSDDPGLWGARGLSYDFYEAFMGMTPKGTDLRFLKQLAMNSLRYSALPAAEKINAMKLWQKNWDKFVEESLNLLSSQT